MLRKAWTGAQVEYQGKHFAAAVGNCVLPTPVQESVPIWDGGNAAPAIRRAVELCEGWSPFKAAGGVSKATKTQELSSITQLREKIAYAHNHAEKIGRSKPLAICMGIIGATRNVLARFSGKCRMVW